LLIKNIIDRITAFKHRFINVNGDNYKFRIIALVAAGVLGIFALVLWFSLMGAVFGIKSFNPLFGSFFSHAYGILAFFIPIYLGYAAFVLADPHWQPSRIFILGTSPVPFFTLALGFICIRDFDVLSEEYVLLEVAGKTGIGLAAVVLALIEVAAIQMLRSTLFLRMDEEGMKITPKKKNLFLLSPPAKTGTNNVHEELAATGEWVNSSTINGQALRAGNTEDFSIDLPAMRPLNTPIALEYLGDSGQKEEFSERISRHKENTFDSTIRAANSAKAAGIERALEEAEAVAAIHGEQIRRKSSASQSSLAKASTRPGKKKYHVPVSILNEYPDGEYWVIDRETHNAAFTLKETLEEFKIQAEVTGIRKGPVITMFEILPAPGVKLSRIVNLQDNIALRLAASSVRIVAPIPGKHAVGIEVPNAKRNIVSFREIIEGELQREGKRPEIPVVLGKDISGEAQTLDLTQTPHLLIAGATGSGKSVCVNAMILSILYQLSPADCRLILIDPKIVELKLYNDIPHLLTPVITEPKRAFQALQYCIYEMERRYACLDSMGVRDIRNYNKRIKERNIAQEKIPYIVIIIDEFADLMATTGKELENTVARLAAMSRAVGIHLVLATQRPSIDVITGLIKANIPSRIAFMVASKMDSRIIIDMVGAEKLLGKGDMLYAGVVDPFPIRMQGAFVSEEEVEAVVAHVKTLGEPDYIDDEIFYDEDEEDMNPSLFSEGDDPLYDKALEIVMQQGKASASYIQRRLKIGYNRAARLVEEMENKGIVGAAQGSKPRELLRGV